MVPSTGVIDTVQWYLKTNCATRIMESGQAYEHERVDTMVNENSFLCGFGPHAITTSQKTKFLPKGPQMPVVPIITSISFDSLFHLIFYWRQAKCLRGRLCWYYRVWLFVRSHSAGPPVCVLSRELSRGGLSGAHRHVPVSRRWRRWEFSGLCTGTSAQNLAYRRK